jgi:hypothetical protein
MSTGDGPMANLYLDHSVVSHEPSWQSARDVLALPGMRLVLSVWNLVEIGGHADLALRERRISFLEAFNPSWVLERVPVQKREVARFVSKQFFGVETGDVQVFTPHLSVVEADLAGPKTHIGLTARQWIQGIDYARIEKLKEYAPNALKILQTVDKKSFKAKQKAIFKKWIGPLIFDVGPDGKPLTLKCKGAILDYCEKHQKEFFAVCKSLHVEDALTDARVANPGRNPQHSDGIDLMHAVIALAYCDYFVVRDGFVAQCADRAIKKLAPVALAKVYRDPDALLKAATAKGS